MLTASDPKGEKPESITSPESAIADFYEDARVPGQVIGSFSPTGVCRQGRDVERQISIDHQALRFQPLLNPGWGRQGIVYGPYTRQNGLALAVFLLNGHNTSQIERLEPLGKRFKQWLRGAAQAEYWDWPRLKPWIASFQKYWMGRRVVWWIKATAQFSRYFKWPRLDENLAVGWFSQDVPLDPITTGNTLVIHATGAKNGELWARVGKQMLRVVQGLQNLQIYYVVILRERGAAYYGATVPNARGLAAYPNLRPLGIDPFNQDTPLYGGVYQSILGQFGFRVDTRVYGTQITPVTGLNTWYGTAQMADRLRGTGDLSENLAEVGGQWQVISGHYERTALGTRAIQADSLATTRLAQPPGLIHVLVRTPAQVAGVKLLWRIQDQHHFWCLWAESDRCCLGLQVGDCWRVVAASELWFLLPDQLNSLQILDEGHTFSLYLNGRLLFNKWFIEPRFQDATGVGLATVKPDPDLLFQDFEVHPRQIPLPPELNLGSPWIPGEMPIAILEDFTGEPGDLEGHSITGGAIPDAIWRRELGSGTIKLTGTGTATVQASVAAPNPGRTAYTVAWQNPEFADLQVNITPPGNHRWQGQKGRGGLIFWQDRDNYILIANWLDDVYDGASVSSFFHLNGFEELYDAVWSNVGNRIQWGVPHQFRAVFDGGRYIVFINDEPLLYRALTDIYPNIKPLHINRVGIVANWEWGDDTGSMFQHFIARG